MIGRGPSLLGRSASLGAVCEVEMLVGRLDCWAISAEAVMTRASWVPAIFSRLGSSLAARMSSCRSRILSSVEDGSAAKASLY
jgi:hypothetical protein